MCLDKHTMLNLHNSPPEVRGVLATIIRSSSNSNRNHNVNDSVVNNSNNSNDSDSN